MGLQDTEVLYGVVQTIKELGQQITHRHVVTSGGANPSTNPVVGSISVAAASSVGAAAVTLTAPAGAWFLAVGDVLAVAGSSSQAYTVTANTTAASGKFTNVPISPSLVAAVSSGAPVAPTFTNDYPVLANICKYDPKLVDGTLITARDSMVQMLTTDVNGRSIPLPTPTDRQIIGGGAPRFVGPVVTPYYVAANPVLFEVQAKG